MILRGKRKRNKSNNYSFIINNKIYKNHNTKMPHLARIYFLKSTHFSIRVYRVQIRAVLNLYVFICVHATCMAVLKVILVREF